jgi:hypothetical protein
MVREEARRTLLREYDRWAKDHPGDAINNGGVVFFSYLQNERSDLLDFHAVGGDMPALAGLRAKTALSVREKCIASKNARATKR